MIIVKLLMLGLLTIVGMATVALACPIDTKVGMVTENDQYRIALTFDQSEIKVSEPFHLYLEICRNDEKTFQGQIKVDAQMPAHGHGMNYRPTLTEDAPNLFKGEGFVFHMPGRWQFEIRAIEDKKASNLVIDYQLK